MNKILIIVNDDYSLYNFRLELIERLIQNRKKVIVSCSFDERLSDFQQLGITCIDTKLNRHGKNPVEDFKLFLTYRKILKLVQPDMVFSYTIKPNIYGGMACRFLKVPFIANITGLGSAVENAGFLQKLTVSLYKIALKNPSCIFFQNAENMQFFIDRKIALDTHALIPGSGVNLSRFTFTTYPEEIDKHIKFLYIGRILKDKGVGELLEAVTSIYQEKGTITCDLVGFYEDESFKQSITDYENLGAGTFLGVSKNISSVIKEYHAVILPSYHEGMANVLLEAAASGRPVLASKVPGCQETFDEGVSGIGFEAKNVDSLYSAIKKFLSLTPEQREAMGRAGRAKMEREFDRQIVVDAYMEQIEKHCSAT